MKALLVALFLTLSLSSFATPEGLSNIYNVIKHVETNNRPNAVGDGGKAYGIVQIHKIAVDDVNRIYGTTYTHKDAFDVNCAREIFNLYLKAGIKRYRKLHGITPTEEQIVRMWNGGLYRGYKKKSTIKYWRRYLKFKKMLQPKKYLSLWKHKDKYHGCSILTFNRGRKYSFLYWDRERYFKSLSYQTTK